MSHEVRYTACVMPELSLIAEAAPRVGCTLDVGRTTRKSWAGRQVKCDHALRVTNDDGAFEAGLVGTKAGYVPEFDTYGTGGSRLLDRIGAGGAKLLAAYAECGVEEFSRQNGYTIESRRTEVIDGEESLVLEVLCN